MKLPKNIASAAIIVNPASGKGDSRKRLEEIKRAAEKRGWKGDFYETTKEIPGKKIVEKAIKKGAKHIIIGGGDGSIMEILEILRKHKVTLGIIPLGTGNLLARNLSIPLTVEEALDVALFGKERRIDIGKANETHFSVVAGMGLDAQIMESTDRNMKDKLGYLAYFLNTMKHIHGKSFRYKVSLDNKTPFTMRAKTIMAANMGKIMGGIEVVPHTDPQSGTLQIAAVKTHSTTSWINLFIHAIVDSVKKSPHYEIYKAKSITIQSLEKKITYQADGDSFAPTKTLNITIYPQAITILTPQ